MEIMALGVPIVSTNVGGLPYLLEDKQDAFLVEKNDVIFHNYISRLMV